MIFLFSDDATTQGKLEDVEQTYIAEESAAAIVVQTRSLDSLVDENLIPSPDFMKIDVEGAAASVFAGAARILDEIGLSIYIVLHGPEERDVVNTTLRQHGYRIYDVQGKLVDDLISGGLVRCGV